jgi:ABC-type amino acid transport substrate-binding protein
LGYRVDASPFSYRDDAGGPAGYSIALCQKVADAVKEELRMPKLAVEWIPVTASERFEAVRQRTIDVLCGADTVSISRRKLVAFSIPIFPGGVGVLLRSDAPARLKDILSGKGQAFRPTWRASASETLQFKSFAAVTSTTAEGWLRERINDLKVTATVAPVATYDAGMNAVVQRRADALFGERAILLDLAKRRKDVAVIDRLFTYEPLAFALPAGDEPFRLVVDRTLAQFYAFGPLHGLYARWFGEPDESAIAFFRWSTIPD